MNETIKIIGAAVAAYLLAKRESNAAREQLQSQLNEVNDQLIYTTEEIKEQKEASTPAKMVQLLDFAGVVSGYEGGDKLISYRWWVKMKNISAVDISVIFKNSNVTMFGQSQLKRTQVNVSYTLPAKTECWCLVGAGNSVNIYPKKTITSQIKSVPWWSFLISPAGAAIYASASKGSGYQIQNNIPITVEYAVTAAYINSGVPTESTIQTCKGKVRFRTAMAPTVSGWDSISNAGMASGEHRSLAIQNKYFDKA